MRVYSSTSRDDFIYQLRESAIRAKAGPLTIDQIDKLGEPDENNEQIQALEEEIDDLKSQIEDLKERIRD